MICVLYSVFVICSEYLHNVRLDYRMKGWIGWLQRWFTGCANILNLVVYGQWNNISVSENSVKFCEFGTALVLATLQFQYQTRAEELIITRLRIGHTNATKSHIVARGPPIDRWSHAPGVRSVTGMSWRILHSWLTEDSLWDDSRGLYNGIS